MGYTGSGGFEIYCKNEQAEAIWNKVFEAGKAFNIKPIGLAAPYATFWKWALFVRQRYQPHDFALEAGLGWITKFNKDFINSDSLKQQKRSRHFQKTRRL